MTLLRFLWWIITHPLEFIFRVWMFIFVTMTLIWLLPQMLGEGRTGIAAPPPPPVGIQSAISPWTNRGAPPTTWSRRP